MIRDKHEKLSGIVGGYEIIEDPRLTKLKQVEYKAGWFERLFSLPWMPQVKMRSKLMSVPSDEIIQYKNKLIVHPEIAKELYAHIYTTMRKTDTPNNPEILKRGQGYVD